jgi:uncharacterized beta-barrel protein YwiB (DUF1934 family)
MSVSGGIPVRIDLRSSWDGGQTQYVFKGELYHKDTALYVRYVEKDEEEGEIRTLVKLAEREIKIRRYGHVESEQTYVLHERKAGYHRTRLGTLPVTTDTLELEVRKREGLYIAAWTYVLHVADEPAGTFHLKLTIREEGQ